MVGYRVLILGFVVISLSPMLYAHDVALRNGSVIHFQNYRVVNNELLYKSKGGQEQSILLTDINFARTRELNENENPPLDVAGLIAKMNTARKSPAPPKPPPPPLGDVVRQLGLKGDVDAEGHVFTNDDFPSSPIPPAPENATPSAPTTAANAANSNSDWSSSKAKIERFVTKTEQLTEQQYAIKILGPDLADIEFPKRSAWQTKIYAEHQKYVADAKLCISDRVSDEGRHQDAACSRLDFDKSEIQSLRDKGKQSAQTWKSRQ